MVFPNLIKKNALVNPEPEKIYHRKG